MATLTDLEIARDLRAAAEHLRAREWWQDGPENEGSGVCLVIAIRNAVHWQDINTHILALDFATYVDAYHWNDHPERTKKQVLDRLESTALALEIRALAASAESLAAERLEITA